jgi:RHS repeat-associated protein
VGHLLGEYDVQGRPIEETVWLGDIPVAVMDERNNGNTGAGADSIHYINPDHLNAPHIITDNTNAVVWSWIHEPFGNTDPVVAGKFRFDLGNPGWVRDPETGTFDNGFRTFSSTHGVYLQPDPLGQIAGVDPYIYGEQNPISRIDPHGLFWEEVVAAPVACALNPICRVGAVLLGQRIASNFVLYNAAAIQNTPLVIAATQENTTSYFAAGLMCGAVKGALPDGVITPGISLPEIGNPAADMTGELLMDQMKELMGNVVNYPGSTPVSTGSPP